MPDPGPVLFERAALPAWRPSRPLLLSVAAHLLLFAIVLHGRNAIFVAPKSALLGAHGKTITHVYWSASNGESAGASEAQVYARARQARQPGLVWKHKPQAEVAAEKHEPAWAAPPPSAGSAYGSMSSEATDVAEIRPALPARTSEPRESGISARHHRGKRSGGDHHRRDRQDCQQNCNAKHGPGDRRHGAGSAGKLVLPSRHPRWRPHPLAAGCRVPLQAHLIRRELGRRATTGRGLSPCRGGSVATVSLLWAGVDSPPRESVHEAFEKACYAVSRR